MLRRWIAFVFCLLLLTQTASAEDLVLPETPSRQAQQQAIAEAFFSVREGAEPTFLLPPSSVSPYAIGKTDPAYLQAGIGYFNFLRQLAGLAPVEPADHLCVKAQYGAVLLAADDDLTHTPPKPEDMDEAFYRMGANACASANLSMRFGYPENILLQSALQGHMDELSAANRAHLGHRRWLLNPALAKTGFGVASSAAGRWYVAVPVTDETGREEAPDTVLWPAAGFFPNNLFAPGTPWSIQLSPAVFAEPEAKTLSVVITRQRDGKFFVPQLLSPGEEPDPNLSYLLVSSEPYGTGSCISFSIAPEELGDASYWGDYTVDISGLYTKEGEPAPLSYTVRFFNADWISSPADWAQDEVTEAIGLSLVPEALQDFYDKPITRLEFCRLAMQWLRCRTGLTDEELLEQYGAEEPVFFPDCADPEVLTAAAVGAVRGTDKGLFLPGESITRQDAAVLLCQAYSVIAPLPEPEALPDFADAETIPEYAQSAVACCASLRDGVTGRPVMSHTGENRFDPLNTYTREQAILTVLRLFRSEVPEPAPEAD